MLVTSIFYLPDLSLHIRVSKADPNHSLILPPLLTI
jgi:hypothetical protein